MTVLYNRIINALVLRSDQVLSEFRIQSRKDLLVGQMWGKRAKESRTGPGIRTPLKRQLCLHLDGWKVKGDHGSGHLEGDAVDGPRYFPATVI